MLRPIPGHGTAARYQGSRRTDRWEPCRCEPCTAAYRLEAKKQEMRRLRGIPSFADRAPVAAHLRILQNAGWTNVQIAAAARVSPRAITGILRGDRPGVQHATARALLALRPEDRPVTQVAAAGATRRLRALAVMGWSARWVSRQTGYSERSLSDLYSGKTTHISVERADAIKALYRSRVTQPGPSAHSRAIAARNGWHGPMAWDATAIDDPDAAPETDEAPDVVEHKRDELSVVRRQEILHLSGSGVSAEEIQSRLQRDHGVPLSLSHIRAIIRTRQATNAGSAHHQRYTEAERTAA